MLCDRVNFVSMELSFVCQMQALHSKCVVIVSWASLFMCERAHTMYGISIAWISIDTQQRPKVEPESDENERRHAYLIIMFGCVFVFQLNFVYFAACVMPKLHRSVFVECCCPYLYLSVYSTRINCNIWIKICIRTAQRCLCIHHNFQDAANLPCTGSHISLGPATSVPHSHRLDVVPFAMFVFASSVCWTERSRMN